MKDPRIYKLAWTFLHGIGPQRSRQLLAALSSADELFELEFEVLSQITGLSLKVLKKIKREKAVEKAINHLTIIDKYKCQMLFIMDDEYPKRLKQCVDAPLVIFYKGNIDFTGYHFVAIVGTRACSAYGKRVVEEFVDACVGHRIVIVSGLAYGIDICAHRRCLEKGVPTISVFGHGFDLLYPSEHTRDAKRILENGAWVSEFPPGTKLDPGNFPMRNRIVAGLSDLILVIESKEKGGSLITAELGQDYNREVMAVPGPIYEERSAGCNLLISLHKAQLYGSPEQLFKWMNWNKKVVQQDLFSQQEDSYEDLPEEQLQLVYLLMEDGPMHMDVISAKQNLTIAQSSVLLFQMETSGLVRSLPGNMYTLMK